MSEYGSEVANAMDNLADAIRTLAASICTVAAGAHTENPYDQRQMGAVFFEDAKTRFPDVLKKVNKRQREAMDRYISGLVKPK